MEWKFVYELWNEGWRWIGSGKTRSSPTPNDEDLTDDADDGEGPSDRKARRRHDEETTVQLRREQEQKEIHDKKEEEAHQWWMLVWLASEEFHRKRLELPRSIVDAKKVVRAAYDRSLEEGHAVGLELEAARRNAVVLADGRRVYFTRDGRHLYGEDLVEITDETAIEEARERLRSKPGATDYETFKARDEALTTATERAHQLAATLQKLDDLNDELETGKLTPEQLSRVQRQTQEIIESLPSEAREEYERIHAARQDGQIAYRAADPAYEAPGLDLRGHFMRADRAIQSPEAKPESGQKTGARPAYRDAPDF